MPDSIGMIRVEIHLRYYLSIRGFGGREREDAYVLFFLWLAEQPDICGMWDICCFLRHRL